MSIHTKGSTNAIAQQCKVNMSRLRLGQSISETIYTQTVIYALFE